MKMTLKHDGAYVATFEVVWKSGQETHVWEGNNKHKTRGFKWVIDIPEDATDVKVITKGQTGLVFDPWHTTCNITNFPTDVDREVRLYGTTLNQHCSITPAY